MRAASGLIFIVLLLFLAGSASAAYNVDIGIGPTSDFLCNGASPNICEATRDNAKFSATDLASLLSVSSVTITTGSGGAQAGDITISAPINYAGEGTPGLMLASAGSIGGNAGISGDNYGVSFQPGTDSTYSGPISGGVSVIKKSGAGKLTLAGANTYSGTTTIGAGNTLQVGNGAASGTLGTSLVTNDGALVFKRSDIFNVVNAISGTGSLTQSGTGTLVFLNPANTYTGTTTIDSGRTLQIGDGFNDGTLGIGAITNNGALIFDRPTLYSVSNPISGTGTLTVTGVSYIQLTEDNTYTGTTTIENGGSLDIGDGGTTGTLGTGAVTNNGALVFDHSDFTIIDNAISGTGTLIVAGVSNIQLTGANSYTGNTIIESGSGLYVGNGAASGTIGTGAVSNDGFLTFERSDSITVASDICGTGTLYQTGSGTTILTGSNYYTGTTYISHGTLQIGNGGSNGILGTGAVSNEGALVFNRSDYYIVGNAISGTGTLTVMSPGEIKLTGTNSYSGMTTINSGGTLRIGYESSATGTLGSGIVTNNGNLVFDRSGSLMVTSDITGSGSLGQIGSGTTTLMSSMLAYTGDTSARAGKLVFGTTVPSSGIWIMSFNSPTSYGRMVLKDTPNIAGKTINVEIPAPTGPYDKNIISWTGSAIGTPSLMMNGVPVTSGEYVGNLALVYSSTAGVNVKSRAAVTTVPTTTVPISNPSPTDTPGTNPTPGQGNDDNPPGPAVVEPPAGTTEVNVGGNSAVTEVTVTGTGISDLIVTGTVQPGPPSGVDPPPGIAYQYIDLTPSRYTTITGATITFTVPVTWLEESHISPGDVRLNRYTNSKWNTLPTTVLKTQNGQVWLSSESPGFSYFAIIGVSRSSAEVASEEQTGEPTRNVPAQNRVTPAAGVTAASLATTVPAAASTTAAGTSTILSVLAFIGIGGVACVAVGIIARRWWIRRQNPDLFEDEK